MQQWRKPENLALARTWRFSMTAAISRPLVGWMGPRSLPSRLRRIRRTQLCSASPRSLESGDKLAAEDTAEHFDGKEERAAGGDPAAVLWSEAAGGQHAVDMRMMS